MSLKNMKFQGKLYDIVKTTYSFVYNMKIIEFNLIRPSVISVFCFFLTQIVALWHTQKMVDQK